MLEVEISRTDMSRLDEKLTEMLHKIDHFGKVDMGREMSDWQTKDLHRHRPFTMRWRGTMRKVQTVVRPHSLRELLGKRGYARKVLHLKVGRAPRHHRQYRHWSNRPILRELMIQLLIAHMTDAFKKHISW